MTADRWRLMAQVLAGEPPPELPAIPGRVIRVDMAALKNDPTDAFADRWDAQHRSADETTTPPRRAWPAVAPTLPRHQRQS